MIVNDRAEINI